MKIRNRYLNIAIHNAQISHYTGGTERLIGEQLKNLLDYPNLSITLVTTKTILPSDIYKEILKTKKRNFRIKELGNLDEIIKSNKYDANNPTKWHFESIEFGKMCSNFYQKNKFDLIITHFSTDSLFVPLGSKNILHLHGYPLNASELGEISLQRPNHFIAVSEFVKSKWIELYPKLNKENISVVYPGIDVSKFVGIEKNRPIDIIFVGRLIKIKGLNYLIKSIKQVKEVKRVIIVGKGPERKSLVAQIKSAGLTKIIKIRSGVNDRELVNLCNKSKLAVFPSYSKEGVILAMLECAAAGCAIITTKRSSMEEFIENNQNGLLCRPKDVNDLSSKIKNLIKNQVLRKKLSQNAKDSVIKDWDSKKRVGELYKEYLNILEDRANVYKASR